MAPHSRSEEVGEEDVPRPKGAVPVGKKAGGGGGGGVGRAFTWEQLSAHNKDGDAYVAIHGGVYNVTEWREKHPGGRDVLLVAAGRDVSQVDGPCMHARAHIAP